MVVVVTSQGQLVGRIVVDWIVDSRSKSRLQQLITHDGNILITIRCLSKPGGGGQPNIYNKMTSNDTAIQVHRYGARVDTAAGS